jgi:hypothetical protein
MVAEIISGCARTPAPALASPGERGKLLEELKTVLCAYLDAKLAALD